MQFHLENMKCGGCAMSVTAAIQSIDPNASVATDPPSRLVKIETSASQQKIVAALQDAGFPPREA